jgi:hypothetical protein
MKTLLLVLLVSASISGLRAAPAAGFGEVSVPRIAAKVNANGDEVTPGTSRVHVRLRLGAPTWVLTDGSWVYSNYVMLTSAGDTGRPASLLVRFGSDRVARLALIDESTLVALRETPRAPIQNQFVAVAKASR